MKKIAVFGSTGSIGTDVYKRQEQAKTVPNGAPLMRGAAG